MSGDSFSRRYEVVAEARRRWSETEKQAIVAEAAAPGANISAVARRHGIKPSLLFRWRRIARKAQASAPEGAFIPIALALPPAEATPTTADATQCPPAFEVERGSAGDNRIEIALGNGRLVRVDADVDASALKRILDVVDCR